MSRSASAPSTTSRPLALFGLLLVVVVVAATAFGGGAAPLELGDPGPFVRWSLPTLRAIHDGAAAVTIGALVLAAFIVPETTRTSRRRTLAHLAGGAAIIWFLAGVGGLLTNFASLAGIRLTDPNYLTQLAAFIWQLDGTRTATISALVVAVVALCAPVAESKSALGWLAAASLFALLPLALSGHSAASLDHMGGVNGLAFHILSATLWVGGLVALVVIRPSLGKHLQVTVQRYSVIAGWCFVLLVGSGLLVSWINIGALSGLASRYGVLLILKSVAAVLLGLAGWWHRHRTIAALQDTANGMAPLRGSSVAPQGSAFTRLAVGEVAVMAAAFGLGAAVGRTPTPPTSEERPETSIVYDLSGYLDPGAPDSTSWLTAWQTDWLWVTVAVIAIVVYLRWAVRLHSRGDRWPLLRTISWVLGWLVFVYFTSGGVGVYGRILFSWHMIEHMGVAMIVPLLLVPGAPITLALRALPARKDKTMGPREFILATVHSTYLRVLANPVIAASFFFFSLAIFYYSPLFELAMRTHTGHVLMMVHFLATGYMFTWVLIGTDPGPKRWSPIALLVVLFVTISFHAFFGVLITQSTELLAANFFGRLDLPWMTTPVADQRTGGAIAWGVGEVPTLVLAVTVAWQWMKTDDRESTRRDRRVDRDGDAELAAYNAQLAVLARRDEQ
ncbi:cytochrome c oxidase assembly protein [Janibacter cremeus]|uniref:Putative copper resistance protein D n=1 Tax=Janibacter cremeus TaxID=1285192 RepID=A0A852VQY1_9MICO|nr:cytochrome c oxidase assembly protein [Janibacter cremeus]NYF98626.1 putative copper resistance protein D [Janibacter cremeus]